MAAVYRGRVGLTLLLLTASAWDLVRVLTVPPGVWNIDESYHFVDILNAVHFLPYAVRRAVGFADPPPRMIPGGTVLNPQWLFHPPGALPYRGTAYYLLQAVPQLFLESASDSTRLFVARLVSVGLHLVVISLTYWITRQMFPTVRWLPLTSATLAALVPSYSDMMSAVNLDVGVAVAGSLFIAGLVQLVLRRSQLRTAALLFAGVVLGLGTKETSWPLLAAGGFAFWMRLGGWQKSVATVGTLVFAAGTLVWLKPLTKGGAAYWFDHRWAYGLDAALVSRDVTDAPGGRFAVRLSAAETPEGVVQYIPENSLAVLRGQTVTWGLWLRAANPTYVDLSVLADGSKHETRPLVDSSWAFHAYTTQVDADARHLALHVRPVTEDALVDFDGAVLALGTYPIQTPPVFADRDMTNGEWAGRPFVNLLLNASGETGWPQVRQEYNLRPWNLNTRLNTLLAWRRTLPAFADLGRWLLANYWSAFGGLLPGLSSSQVIPFALLTAWSGLGLASILVINLPRQSLSGQELQKSGSVWVLLAAATATWFVALYRSDFAPNAAQVIVWSVSRHASAGLSATTTLYGLGLLHWLPRRFHAWALAVLLVGLFAANIWILLGVQVPYYQCQSALPTDCLLTVH